MSTLILEAFGQLSPGTNLIDSEEEDLYSVFRARSELMGWSTTSGRLDVRCSGEWRRRS